MQWIHPLEILNATHAQKNVDYVIYGRRNNNLLIVGGVFLLGHAISFMDANSDTNSKIAYTNGKYGNANGDT